MRKALAPELSTWPDDEPRLIGSRCASCAAIVFPKQDRCPNCSQAGMSEELLPRRGKVVAWTTQGFLPHPGFAGGQTQETFEPFAVGLVQLGDALKVEGRLTEGDPEKLSFGMEVELTMFPFYVDDEGAEVMAFAFAPVETAEGGKS